MQKLGLHNVTVGSCVMMELHWNQDTGDDGLASRIDKGKNFSTCTSCRSFRTSVLAGGAPVTFKAGKAQPENGRYMCDLKGVLKMRGSHLAAAHQMPPGTQKTTRYAFHQRQFILLPSKCRARM